MFDGDLSELERQARRLLDRPLGDLIDIDAGEYQHGRTRGGVGHHYEAYFGVPRNSDAGPDIPALGVELKAVPMTRTSRGRYKPKERTFITAIDYGAIADEEFEGSPLDTKTRLTLYLFYEHQREVEVRQFRTLAVLLHARDEVDELMLREAHGHVRQMVLRGLAHEISEADTYGVGAATKDARARDIPQPRSRLPARRRAFAWKPAVTERLWLAGKPGTRHALARPDVPDALARFEADVLRRLQPWTGVPVRELRDRLMPSARDDYKALTSAVSRRALDTRDSNATETFERLGITVRTMRVDPDTARPKEAVSFPAFDPRDLAAETWETSTLLASLRDLFFIVFTQRRHEPIMEARLDTGFFWRPSSDDLDVMEREWTGMRDAIARSAPEELPRSGETEILHVRPHGRDGRDIAPLPNGTPFRRSSFWLNQRYLQAIVARHRS